MVPPAGGVQSAGALRDKIAKFEKKGGVPVPRGSFGLGAPPSADGPRRRGELYGNRMPAPARALSAQYTGGSRASSPIGSFVDPNARRSFSTSIVTGDFDDGHLDYSPMSSPTFTFPPDPPNSMSPSPESSPTHSTTRDPSKRPLLRGTSFHEAMEIARKAEVAKLAAVAPPTGKVFIDAVDGDGVAESSIISTIPSQSPRNLGPIEDTLTISAPTKVSITYESPNQPFKILPPAGQPSSFDSSVEPSRVIHHDSFSIKPDIDISKVSVPFTPGAKPLTIRKRSQTEASTEKPKDASILVPCDTASEVASEQAKVVDSTSMPSGHPAIPSAEGYEPRSSVESSATVRAVQQISEVKETHAPDKPQNELHSEDIALGIFGSKTGKEASVSKSQASITSNDVRAKTNISDFNEPQVFKSKAPTSHTIDASRLTDDSSISPPTVSNGMAASSSLDAANMTFGDSPVGKSEATPLLITISKESTPDMSADGQARLGRTRPTIQLPDSSSFLSPPPSSFRSALVVSDASPSPSPSSSISRPLSMLSPAEVSRALRMTPATSRGVPMFLPPNNTQPRKSDFVYLPPSPEDERNAKIDDADEFGVVVFGHHRHGSESDLTKPSTSDPSTFKAVVHRKVTEIRSATVPAKKWVLPETPDKRATILQTPLSPGHEELATLLQEAMLLEDTLSKKGLPGEPGVDKFTKPEQGGEEAAKAREEAKLKEEERRRIAYATAQLQSKRDMPTQGRLKHTFLMPLSKVKAMHRKGSTTTVTEPPITHKSQEDVTLPKSAGLPVRPGTPSAVQEPIQVGQGLAAETHPRNPSQTSAPKSSKSSRFPSLKRFGSISLSSSSQTPRQSNSTSSEISSEDSNLIVTPPDNTLDFGQQTPASEGFDNDRVLDLSLTFPSLSPKKSTSSIARAASLAEKLWSRARTRSNGSVLSSNSVLTRENHLFNYEMFSLTS